MPSIAESLRKGTPGIMQALEMFQQNKKREDEEARNRAFAETLKKLMRDSEPKTVIKRTVENVPGADVGTLLDQSKPTEPQKDGQNAPLKVPPLTLGEPQKELGERLFKVPELGKGITGREGMLERMKGITAPKTFVTEEEQTETGRELNFSEIVNLLTLAGGDPGRQSQVNTILSTMEARRKRKTPRYTMMNQEGGGYDQFVQEGEESPLKWLSGRAGAVKPNFEGERLDETIRHNKAMELKPKADADQKDVERVRKQVAALVKQNETLGQENVSYGQNMNPKTAKPFVDAKKKPIAGYGGKLLRQNVQRINANMKEIARLHGLVGSTFEPVMYDETTGVAMDGGGEGSMAEGEAEYDYVPGKGLVKR